MTTTEMTVDHNGEIHLLGDLTLALCEPFDEEWFTITRGRMWTCRGESTFTRGEMELIAQALPVLLAWPSNPEETESEHCSPK